MAARTALLFVLSLLLGFSTAQGRLDAIKNDDAAGTIELFGETRRASAGPVLITGATGRTGRLVYESLKDHGVQVRALVRSAAKAKEVLSCGACTPAEGIFVGDVTDPSTLPEAFDGVKQVVVLTASIPLKYPNGTYYYPPGGAPKDIHWIGTGNQARAAIDAGVEQILYVSATGTTRPGGFFDKLANGWAVFYRLNGEADLMSSGVPFTIVKPGPLLDTEGGQSRLLVGHNDVMEKPHAARADVAAVLVNGILMPEESKWLRFDLSSDESQPATGDFKALFRKARDWRGDAPDRNILP